MRSLLVLLAAGAALLLPAAAQATVGEVGGTAIEGTSSGTITVPIPVRQATAPRQLWVVGMSTIDSVTVDSVTVGSQQLTRTVSRALGGVRSELWTLANPDTTVSPVTASVTLSGPSAYAFALIQFTNTNRIAPVGDVADAADSVPETSATIALPHALTPGDSALALLTGANGANMSSISALGGTRLWPPGPADPLGVSGVVGQSASVTWSWTSADPLAANPWTAAMLAVKEPDPPGVSTGSASSVTKTGAVLNGSVNDDGGGDLSATGFVYCAGCSNPVISGPGVTRVSTATAVGSISTTLSGLPMGTDYTVRAYATNDAATSYGAAQPFSTLPNEVPTASAGGPYAITESDGLTLDAGASSDPEGDPLDYSWDINGDGTYDDATGAHPALTWSQLAALGLDGPNTYTVHVQVSDGTNPAVTSPGATLTLANAAPTGTFGGDASVPEGAGSAQVSFTGVTDDSPADVAAGIRYAYDFDGDGTYDVGGLSYASASTSASATVPASLLAEGPATVTVHGALIDKDGGVSTYTTTIDVTDAAPTATLTGATVTEGDTATVAFGDQADSPDDVSAGFTYEWSVGGGPFTPGDATLDVPAPDGPATIPVRGAIIDRDGGRTEYDATVTVDNAPPVVTVSGPDTAPWSGETTVTITATDPGDDEVTGTIDWGDGTTSALQTGAVAHRYADAGAHEITVTAHDSDGADAVPATHTVTVAAPPPVIAPPAIAPPDTPAPPVLQPPVVLTLRASLPPARGSGSGSGSGPRHGTSCPQRIAATLYVGATRPGSATITATASHTTVARKAIAITPGRTLAVLCLTKAGLAKVKHKHGRPRPLSATAKVVATAAGTAGATSSVHVRFTRR